MQSGKNPTDSHIEYQPLMEGKDIENPASSNTDQLVINSERHEKLKKFKDELINFNSSFRYLSQTQRYYYIASAMAGGAILGFGGTLLAIKAPRENFDTTGYIEYGALIGVGAITLGCSLSFMCSSKLRAYILGKLNKPITLRADFNIDELNNSLTCL